MDFFCQILLMTPKSLSTPDRHGAADVDDGSFLSILPVLFFFLIEREELFTEHAIHWNRRKIEGLSCFSAKHSTKV